MHAPPAPGSVPLFLRSTPQSDLIVIDVHVTHGQIRARFCASGQTVEGLHRTREISGLASTEGLPNGSIGLECDEFNAESVAGRGTITRLEEMFGRAWFAFIVMTGEDVHGDSATHARENVIHEAGLFQGRLGFERAIILLEEGCAQFSNIHGLTTIRFPKDDIEPKYEEIRRVLEREVASGDKRRGRREAAESDAESQRLREQQDVEDYISYMTEEEREIIAYLLAHNQKMFTNTLDCGHANTLLSRGIVVMAVRRGQVFTEHEVPFAIPEHIWTVLKKHQNEFPYTPPQRGESPAHPWRRHWMEY